MLRLFSLFQKSLLHSQDSFQNTAFVTLNSLLYTTMGFMIGALSDVGILSRRNILFLSFLGSAVSYALIIAGGLRSLIFSRVLVGLVKQTMTVSTGLMSLYTTEENRGTFLGRLSASTTVSWLVGPSLGALLYKHVGPVAPCAVASSLFLINSVLAACYFQKKIPLRVQKSQNVPQITLVAVERRNTHHL